MLGDYAVGKTSLVRRFVEGRFDDRYLSSIGVKVSRCVIELPDLPAIHLLIWDLAGGDDFSGTQISYLQGASGALLVCDLSRASTIDVVELYTQRLRSLNQRISLVLAGNKVDLVDQRKISDEMLATVASSLNASSFVTSAKTGAGVEEAFHQLALEIVNNARL